eukprot:COSAG05_NODE_324_length_11401_cov_6.009379_10_plen_180_part_00
MTRFLRCCVWQTSRYAAPAARPGPWRTGGGSAALARRGPAPTLSRTRASRALVRNLPQTPLRALHGHLMFIFLFCMVIPLRITLCAHTACIRINGMFFAAVMLRVTGNDYSPSGICKPCPTRLVVSGSRESCESCPTHQTAVTPLFPAGSGGGGDIQRVCGCEREYVPTPSSILHHTFS